MPTPFLRVSGALSLCYGDPSDKDVYTVVFGAYHCGVGPAVHLGHYRTLSHSPPESP